MTATMTLTAATTQSRVAHRAFTSPRMVKSSSKAASPSKPPRSSSLSQLSKGQPPSSRSKIPRPPVLSSTSRKPAYALSVPKSVSRGYIRPKTTRLARAIANAEKRISSLLLDPTHALSKRSKPSQTGVPLLPCIDENELFPRPLPPPVLHPMERTEARRPRSRTSNVQDENQPPVPTTALEKRLPTKIPEMKPRAVAYSLPRGVFVRLASS